MAISEAQRIAFGPEPGQPIGGLGSVRIVANCPGNAKFVLERTREAMSVVVAADPADWPSDSDWLVLLPHWFVAQCPEKPDENLIRKMNLLPVEERWRLEDKFWSVDSWVYWFQPENRYWFWWDAEVRDESTVVIALEITEWPFPWGSLKWLLRVAGAELVEAEP